MNIINLIVIILAGIVLIIGLWLRIKEDIERKREMEAENEVPEKGLPTHLQWVEELINNILKIQQ